MTNPVNVRGQRTRPLNGSMTGAAVVMVSGVVQADQKSP